jgi:DNA-binding transcriptional MocR family regulator
VTTADYRCQSTHDKRHRLWQSGSFTGTKLLFMFLCVLVVARQPQILPAIPGIVHWAPPAAALEAVAAATTDPALSQYGPDAGLPPLRQALREKLAAENGLTQVWLVSNGP